MTDVLIIGGGPVGSHAAYRLASMGHRVMVLERNSSPGTKVCCTGIIGQECVRSFGIKDAILSEVNSAVLFSPSGKSIRLHRQAPQASILDRVAFDRAMAYQAQNEGAEYLFDAPVDTIDISDDSVEVSECRRGRHYTARAVIIASGAGSKLSEKLGLGKIADLVGGAQVEVETRGIDEVEVYVGNKIAPGFFAWLVPIAPDTARVGLLSRRSPGLYLRRLLDRLVSEGKIIAPLAPPGYAAIPLKPLPSTSGKRLMVVGDAAGQVKPTTGGGIYYGLLGADSAAETLHEALQDDDLSPKRLGIYDQKWRKRLGQELQTGYWARKLFERLSDRRIDRIFDLIEDQGIVDTLLTDTEVSFDWHSQAVSRLIGHQLIARAVNVVKRPFPTRVD